MNLCGFCLVIALIGLAICNTPVAGESLTCLTVYREGGAPAVFQSPKCPRWTLSDFKPEHNQRFRSPSAICHSAVLQGRRKSQEDRTLCAVDIGIPFPGPKGVKEVKVGIMAVFDGHNGSEASEVASELLLEYFVLHTYFLLDTTYSILARRLVRRLPNIGEGGSLFQKIEWDEDPDPQTLDDGRFQVTLSAILDESFPFELLKEALLRAVHDIDSSFSKDASRYNITSGTTAAVALLADDQILVANIGDSKAFLCSEIYQSPPEAKATVFRVFRERRADGVSSSLKEYHHLKSMASNGWTYFIAKELTNDHHPDRHDEKFRVESAGGNITKWGGVARVNGQLAVSRAIGDIHFKSFGVISVPEVTDWLPLTANDSYVIVASDGVFEKLKPQDICDILWEPLSHFTTSSEFSSSCLDSLADCIVNTAFERGSTDNLAAITVPVKAPGSTETLQDRRYTLRPFDYLGVGGQSQIYEKSTGDNTSVLTELQPLPDVAKFDRLLVEGKHNNYGCFYLSENLDVNDDYTFWVHKDDRESVSHLSPALTGIDHFPWSIEAGGPLDIYNDQHICLHFGMYTNEDKDQCMNVGGFMRFLGLLESIPFHNTDQNEHITSNTRYVLKKKFDRGAYGEVWLAFNWNCSQVRKDHKQKHSEDGVFHRNESSRAYDENVAPSFFNGGHNVGRSDEDKYILKRIMVERGIAGYLSGLREKYFGEIFLNASNSLRGSLSSGEPDFTWKISQCNTDGFINVNESVKQDIEEPPSPEDVNFQEKSLHGAAYEEGLNHIARYVESVESRSNEIWLVFRYEGISLSKLLYTAEEVVADEEKSDHGKRVQILRPSRWWHWLKTTEAGQQEFRNIIRQLLMALKSCHDRNITHRDIKPENMVICFEDKDSGGCMTGSPNSDKNFTSEMRIIDFGSAMNDFSVKHLYGSVGPSSAEQTSEYAPPEAFLNASWYRGPSSVSAKYFESPFSPLLELSTLYELSEIDLIFSLDFHLNASWYRGPSNVSAKYDMWSVGVVMLEVILGSPNVFQINSKTQALLDQHLKGWNDSVKELAYKLRAMMEMCILLPGISSKLHQNWGTVSQSSCSPVPWKCSEDYFSYLIRNRDPLKLGFPNVWALRLVRDLLRWDPEERLGVDEALRHTYFHQAS